MFLLLIFFIKISEPSIIFMVNLCQLFIFLPKTNRYDIYVYIYMILQQNNRFLNYNETKQTNKIELILCLFNLHFWPTFFF